MSQTPTLREALAAQRALSLLDAGYAPSEKDSAASGVEIAAAMTVLGEPDLAPANLSLLRASLSSYDVQAAALRLTLSQARRMLNPPARKSRAKTTANNATDSLTTTGIDTMTSGSWAECIRWLAEQAGYTVEERPLLEQDGLLAWRGRREGASGGSAVVCARRLVPGAPLLGEDMRHLAAIAANEPDARLVALTTAEATVDARLIAREVKADLRDREILDKMLADLATAFARERAQSQHDAKAQAKAAAAARKKLLSALTTADTLAKAPLPAQRATGRPAVRKAVEQAREARRLTAQALLAWETLASEWLATFGERPARDGSLPMLVEPPVWTELGARADHLKKPLIDALRALSKAPGDGDLGYGAWRQALSEEVAARCAALLWRVSMVDPAQWQDFTAAVNDLALREASRADNAASHAAARAERAQSQMVERAGVA